jgi:hypothetical protein
MILGPQIKETQFALLMADGATGHILTTHGQIYHNDGKDVYRVFDDIESVNEYINKHPKNDTIEFSIYNSKYVLIDFRKAPKWS